MINFIKSFFAASENKIDTNRDAFYLADRIIELQKKVKDLEEENKQMKDVLSDIQNRITAIRPVVYNITSKENLSEYTLGDK